MKKQPLVSIIMPVYNAGQYVKDAIDSILSQTYLNFEFIIINGYSYSTAKPMKNFVAQGILVADSTATLKMIVYKNGKNVYEQSLTVEKHAERNNLVFTVLNGVY
jgi:cellulose synthase/poly-beta-1,6-N-acetylglucosamine synthase-like glycosyltransferase